MIYITGDCHGDYRRFSMECFPEQRTMGREDYMIICGDFGYWDDSGEQRWWRNWLAEKSFTFLWVDGNHENYDMLKELPVKEWHGGKVQYIGENVIHLMRGQVYDIHGVRLFSFGGARSHDIQDGILEPSDESFKSRCRELRRRRALFRVNHISWWKEEMPDGEEFEEGRKNLSAHGWKADYIVTHCAPSSIQELFSDGLYQKDELTEYLEEIRRKCQYKKWFFGHYHDNRNVTKKDIMLYEQMIRIG